MKNIQCECGKFYDSDRQTCPFCSAARLEFKETEGAIPQEVPGILLFGVIFNVVFTNILSYFFVRSLGWIMILQIVYIAFAIFYLIRAFVWAGRYVKNPGIATATKIISIIEIIGGVFGLVMLFFRVR